MRKFALILAIAFLPASAHAGPPSDASLDQLFVAMKVEKNLDTMIMNMEGYIRQVMAASGKGKPLTAEQQRSLDALMPKFMNIFREEMSFEKMRPVYRQIYRESLTQEEVDGMTAFYQTPAGAAVVDKMPVIVQKSMTYTMQSLQPMMARIEQAVKETIAKDKKGE